MGGFKTPEEFEAWQLAWELKERIVAFTATPPAMRDGEFCKEYCQGGALGAGQYLRRLLSIQPNRLCEFRPDRTRFPRRSAHQLRHAHSSKYLTDGEYGELDRLCRRAIGASTGLRLYLLRLPKNFDPRKIVTTGTDRASRNPNANHEPERGT